MKEVRNDEESSTGKETARQRASTKRKEVKDGGYYAPF
jgi:hypothetical protein